ncbi:PQQ-binding-like beta-propeller repeat protein [Natronobacterium texcoconense]|uniref:Outer membrane protein assembly factor BamB, contains PQQ-like beta-propeller repeat n=1 Tax=Natronobacterium texcoconense TaxID=1095778 RepID=A0A1H1HX94_NATTX|nr:PQQ-binding-like beta-propeller repeat protein [Natronobacterium texcoconense]SDR30020.1 Outer membrane protein assembly factor BamB, contains PQQ-like beta-propeller repeat [Natronobacterium texcoconense]
MRGRRAFLAAGASSVVASLAGCFDEVRGALEPLEGEVDVDPASAVDEDAWSVVHGDPGNTRSVPADAVPELPLSIEWREPYETHVGHVRPVSDGEIVIGTDWDEELFAIDADSGERLWTATDPAFEPRSAPVITDEAVLIGSRSALWAFDRDGGERLWRTDDSLSLGTFDSHPNADGDLAIGGTPLGVAAYDLETGERRWRRQIGLQSRTEPAIHGETIYLGGGDATLHALESETGEWRWRTNADTEIRAGPAVTDSRIFVGTDDGTLIAYDHDAEQLWRTDLGEGRADELAVGNGVVCAATEDDALTAVDPASGDRAWRSQRYVSTYANGPTVGGGLVFGTVQSDDVRHSRGGERIGAFDAETGDLEWESEETGLENGPAIVDGGLYVTGRMDRESTVAKLS